MKKTTAKIGQAQINLEGEAWQRLPLKTAQVDVDAMKTFSELCPDELPVPGALELPDLLNKLAMHTDKRIGTKCAHQDEADFVTDDPAEIGADTGLPLSPHKWTRHGRPGTMGFEMLDGLPSPIDYDHFIWKGIESELHPYGVCYHDPLRTLSTGLIEWLIVNQVTRVIITGLAFDYCVATSAEELADTGLFDVIIIRDCTRGINPTNFESCENTLIAKNVRFFDTIEDYLLNA